MQEAINRAAALQDGITQVTTDYKAGDAVVLGELVAYKISNDSAMATVVQKAESAVAAGSTNSQAITELTGQVQAINNTKLDASVISNYYTKGQAYDKSAEIAAGKIESYDANLVIGGANLLKNSNFERELGSSNWSFNGWSSWVKQQDSVHGTILKCVYGSLTHEWVAVDAGATLVFSALVRTQVDRSMHLTVPLHCWAGKDNTQQNLYEVLKKSHVVIPAGVWTKIWVVIKLIGDANSFKPFIYDVQPPDGLEIAWTKLEKGNKVTDWTPNDKEVQQSLNANANAIQSTNAEVARINGEVVAAANSLIGLRSDVDTASANLSANYFTKAETNSVIAGKVEEFSSSLEVGGVNTYNHLSPQISNIGDILVDANHHETPNGLYLVGKQSQTNTLRIGGVITSNGWWTVSFYIRGTQSVNAGFKLDICDTEPVRVQSTADNTWKRITHTSYVDYVSDLYNFVDIADVDWTYVLIKDLKIEKGNVATAWTPHPKLLEDSVANIKNTYVTESKLNSSIAAQSTEITSKLSRMAEGNLLYNADFRLGSLKGWYTVSHLDPFTVIHIGAGHYLYSYGIQAGFSKTVAIHTTGTSSGYVEIAQQVTVKENRRYQLSCYAAAHRCIVQVFCYFYRADGSFISNSPVLEPQQIVNPNEALGGSHLYHYKRIYQNVTTPAGTETLAIVIRRNGGNYAYMFVTRAQVVEIFDENLVEWQSSSVQNDATIKETTQSINGIEAIKTVTIDNNGVMSGYGLISELVNGKVTSSFGVNADTFFIGSPSGGKKPFIQRNDWSQINGVRVPPGTYIDTAFIGAATIGTAHIAELAVKSAKIDNLAVTTAKIDNLAVTTAKIGNLAVTTAKIGDLQVDTLKIKDNAVTIGIGAQRVHTLSTVSGGGKIRLDVGVQAWGSLRYSTVYLRVLRNGTVIRVFEFGGVLTNSDGGLLSYVFSIVCALPPIIEAIPAGTTVTYSIQVGYYNHDNHYRTPDETDRSWVRLSNLSMAITELKK